jgi:hypothetical protein
MRKARLLRLALALLMGALWSDCGFRIPDPGCHVLGCAPGKQCADVQGSPTCIPWPPPSPSPTPKPSPSICPPTPGPVCKTADECGCWVETKPCEWEKQICNPPPSPSPKPTPTPEPTPTPNPPPGPVCQGDDPAKWCGGCWRWLGDRWKQHNKACDGGWCDPKTGAPRKSPPAASDCSTPLERVLQEIKSGNWLPACGPQGAGPATVQTAKYGAYTCPIGERLRGMYGCGAAGETLGCAPVKCVDLEGSVVNCGTWALIARASDPKICIPCPEPTTTPTPVPVPTPTPLPGACPPILEVGGSMLQPRTCAPGCVKDGYLGYVVNWTATPLISAASGLCAPGRNRCEMPKQCQDPRGAYTWLYLPGVFGLGICDQRSDNFFNCHHKPKANETGRTYFISCPWGVMPPTPPAFNPLCTIHVVDVRADKPVEIK